MTNARPDEVGTGAVMNMPGGHAHGTDSKGETAHNAGCPTLHVELYRHTARLHGNRIWQLLEQSGVDARQFDRRSGRWTVPANRIADVICVAEYRQRRFVTVEESCARSPAVALSALTYGSAAVAVKVTREVGLRARPLGGPEG